MIDTHAHLYMFEENGKNIIENMKNDNLQNIVTIGTTVSDSKINIDIANSNENIYATVGIYPEYAEQTTDEDLIQIENLAKNEKVVAIGEIGLDYHREDFNRDAQIDLFVKQLKLADKLGLPFCIHCRDAAEDLYNVLFENRHLINHSGLMHCYSEGAKWVKENIGQEYVEEFLEKYDSLNQGIPIGGFYETMVFLDIIEAIKEQI